jgi:predicted permease
MMTILPYFKQAVRSFLRTPGFTAVVLGTLALGIGANTAMFCATRSLLLRPLPYAEPDRLVALWGTLPAKGVFHNPLSAPNFFDWRDGARSFEGMALYTDETQDLASSGEAESLQGLCVTSGYFELLRVRPLLGRTFVREDEDPHAQPVAIISHGLWLRRFGGEPSVVGRSVRLGGRPTLLVGVLPSGFRAPAAEGQDLFTPFPRDPAGENRGMNAYSALARLRSGVSVAQARAELGAVARAVNERYPAESQGWSATVVDLRRDLAGASARPLLMLQGAVFLLLLIACANVANMLLVRGATRIHEIAIRNALGATFRDLVAQYLPEGLLLGLAGGLLGVAMAWGAIRVMPVLWADTNALGILRAPELDLAVLAFAFALTLATSLVFGLVPVLHARRGQIQTRIQRDSQSSPAMVRLQGLLILGEVALATVLLLGSGLLLRSFFNVAATDPGFDPNQVITFCVGLPETRYSTDEKVRSFNRELVRRLEALPGVERVGSGGYPPLRRNQWATRIHVGQIALPSAHWPDQADINLAGPGYLETLKVPLLQGRGFSRTESPTPEAIVNASFVRRYFPGADPLGKLLQVGLTSSVAPEGTPFEIVGVMEDQRTNTLEEPPGPAVLVSIHHIPYGSAWFVLRSRLPLGALAGSIRAQVAALDGQLAVRELTDLATLVDRNLGDRRQPLVLLIVFGALALVLSGLGIYGVVAFNVAQRTREIGIRMALGAAVPRILVLVIRQGMRAVTLGGLVGLAAFIVLSRFLSSQLYGVRASDPLAILLTLGLLFQTALLACLGPALRAARVAPAEALRAM